MVSFLQQRKDTFRKVLLWQNRAAVAPMQTFLDSKSLAREKNTIGLFGQSAKLLKPGEEETGSAGEQPVRNNLADWNGQGALMPPNAQEHSKSNMS